MSERKRLVLEQEGKLEEPIGRKPSHGFTILGLVLALAMIVIGWVLFIRYTL
jgi:hypothetical protein